MILNKGTQVIYIPQHLDRQYGIAEFDYPNGPIPGFVTSGPKDDGSYFVRYWIVKDHKPINDLRTKSCSELTPGEYLLPVKSVPQEWVNEALEAIG